MTVSAPTLLTSGTGAANQTTHTTASVTTIKDALVIVMLVSGSAGGGSVSPTSVTHPFMGTMTRVIEVPSPNNNIRLTVWTGVATGGTGAFTINYGASQGNGLWQVIQHTSNVATPVIKQSNTMATTASGTIGATLTSAPAADSCVIGAYGINSNTLSVTAGSGFTGIGTRVASSNTPVDQLWSEYDNSSSTAAAPFVVPNSTAGKVFVAMEIVDGVPQDRLYLWNGTIEQECTVTYWDGTVETPCTIGIT